MLLHGFTTGAPHTWVYGDCLRGWVLGALSSVTIKLFAGNVQRVGGAFFDAPCLFTLGYPSPLAAEFLQLCHILQQLYVLKKLDSCFTSREEVQGESTGRDTRWIQWRAAVQGRRHM